MNHRPDRQELAILDALEALGGGEAAAGAGPESRAYVELLGLLPYGLEPVVPSPELRSRVLAAVREHGRAGEGVADDPAAAAPAGRSGAAGPAAAGRSEDPAVAEAASAPAPIPFRRPDSGRAAPPRRAGRWALPLAAALAALGIGLAGWLSLRLGEREATIATLDRELAAAGERAGRLERINAELDAARRELSHRLALATSPGMVACPLKPMDREYPEVNGLLYLSPGGGPWLLSVHRLEPPPAGSVYVVWFLSGDAPHHMGVLAPGPDRSVHIAANRMPGQESMTGVAVTLEPTAAVERPTGPMLLFGDQRISLL